MQVKLPKKHFVQPTSKGQVTLPVRIRRELAIDADTLLNVSVQDGRVILEPLTTQKPKDEQWETVVDFTEFVPNGIEINELLSRLSKWTKSKKRSKN